MSRHAIPGLFFALLCLALLGAGPSDEAEPINPHDRPDACLSCHDAGETPDLVGLPRPARANCESCHPDVQMHAVGLAPKTTTIPESWPLQDGAVSCATCHSEPACDARRPREEPWLRGGPYREPDAMCWSCHERMDFARSDPHHPEDVRDPADPTCSVCHNAVPERGAAAADSHLRLEDGDLCAFCHKEEHHSGVDVHLGVVVEALDPAAAGTVALDAENKIACWSCHEMHGDPVEVSSKPATAGAEALRAHIRAEDWAGLLPDDIVWPAVSRDPEHPPLLGLPGDGTLCSACHGDGP